MTAKQRWYTKANAFAVGWKSQFTSDPPKTAVVLGLAVAQLETKCGDVWPGVHNWGAVQARSLTKAEQAVLHEAGLDPAPSNTDEAQKALSDAVEACKIPAPRGVSLQVDSSPRLKTSKNPRGYYWIFFQSFENDNEAAERFVHVLAANRPACLQVLQSPAGSEQELAAAMYYSRYYEGTHDASTQEGKQKNIDNYASAIRSWTPAIRAALEDWTPGAEPPASDNPDPDSDVWVQWMLNKVGVFPPLLEDGVVGPVTKAAIKEFQRAHGLAADGIAGAMTRAALVAEKKRQDDLAQAEAEAAKGTTP
jgi:peptidoglycan hydrolase-like protein with peptidoglycan-binding domain